MKRILAFALAIVMLVSTVVMLTSCGEEDPEAGAIVNMYYVGDVYDFDPTRAYVDDDAAKLFALLYEPLFTLNDEGGVEYALAKSYKIIEDEEKGVYSMQIVLRDTYWSDGSAVTAEDVLYAWQRILECDFQSQAAPLLYDIKNAVLVKQGEMSIDDLGVSADKKLLTITFESKIDYDAFLRNLTSIALVPLREYVVSKASTYWGKRKSSIITNGPFCVDTLDYNLGEFTLERNQYYRRDPESLKNYDKYVTPFQIKTQWNIETEDTEYMTYAMYLDQVYEQYINGTVFYMGDLSLAKRKELESQAVVSPLMSTYTCVFGSSNAALTNAKVRQALSVALDREYIVELITFAEPATGIVSPGVYNGKSYKSDFREVGGDLIETTGDMQKAIQLLDESGVKLTSTTRRITLGYKEKSEADEAVAMYIQGVWNELGFNVILRPLSGEDQNIYTDPNDSSTLLTIKSNQLQENYEGMITGESSNCNAMLIDLQMFSTNAFAVLCGFTTDMNGNGIDMTLDSQGYRSYKFITTSNGYSSETYDALMDRALAEKDLDARAELLHEAEQMLIDDMVVVPLTFNKSFYISQELSKISVDEYGYPNLAKLKQKNYKQYLPVEAAE